MSYKVEDNQIAQQSANASDKSCKKQVLLFGKHKQYCSSWRCCERIGIKEPCQKNSEIPRENQSVVKRGVGLVSK